MSTEGATAEAPADGGRRGPRDVWWLLLTVYGALLLRGLGPYRRVFADGEVVFQGNDAWYHLRLIEHLVRNFPWRISFDPYAYFPDGQAVGVAPLFDYAAALPAWLLGLGSPSQRCIEVVAAWLPPLLGALVPVPVYFIGRRAFDARVGLLAAGLVALQPGQLLLRSLLGFADHHVAEALLSTVAVASLLAAVEKAGEPGAAAQGPARRSPVLGWLVAAPREWLAGAALGAYLLSWGGGSLFVALLTAWLLLQLVLDRTRARSSADLRRVAPRVAAGAAAVLTPFLAVVPRVGLHLAALTLFAITPWAASAAADGLEYLVRRGLTPALRLPVALTALLAAGAAAWLAAPAMVKEALDNLRRFLPSGLSTTVGEAEPLLVEGGVISLVPLWIQYRWTFFLAVLGLAVLVRLVVREPSPARTLLLVWSLGMALATLAQNRFGYYLAINVALLSALLCRAVLAPLDPERELPLGRRRLRRFATALVVLLAFVPTVEPSLAVALHPRGPRPEWRDALRWMRHNTPEPLGDAGAYLDRYDRPPEGTPYPFPPSAYGVLSWWDYGYWITRIARRIPNANPTQNGAAAAARFFTAGDETEAVEVLEEAGSRYVIVHGELATWPDPAAPGRTYGKLDSMLRWAGEDPSRFYEIYWRRDENGTLRPEPALVYYPAYYESMAARLYNYGGGEVVPKDSTWVISIDEVSSPEGTYKAISSTHLFQAYEDAVDFVESRNGGSWRIVGFDPLASCVPLGRLRLLRQVYHSPQPGISGPGFALPALRIFEVQAAGHGAPASRPTAPST